MAPASKGALLNIHYYYYYYRRGVSVGRFVDKTPSCNQFNYSKTSNPGTIRDVTTCLDPPVSKAQFDVLFHEAVL